MSRSLSPCTVPYPGRSPAHLDLLLGQMGGIEVAAGRVLPSPLEGLQMEVVGGAILHVMLNPEGCVPWVETQVSQEGSEEARAADRKAGQAHYQDTASLPLLLPEPAGSCQHSQELSLGEPHWGSLTPALSGLPCLP